MFNTQVLLIFFICLVIIIGYNTFTKINPNSLTLIFFVGGAIVYKISYAIQEKNIFVILDSILCLILTVFVLYHIFGGKRDSIGGGDMKLVMSIAFLFGNLYMMVFFIIAYGIFITFALFYKHSVYYELSIENEIQNMPTGWIWTFAFAATVVLNNYWYTIMDLIKI